MPPEIALVRSKRHIEDPPRTAPGGDYALVARCRRDRLKGVVFVDVDVDARNECGAPAWLRKRGELVVGGVGGSTSRAFHCSDGSVSDFCERRGSPLVRCWPSSVPRRARPKHDKRGASYVRCCRANPSPYPMKRRVT